MSSGFGDGASVDPVTMRDHAWPCLRQFCVFMENRVGRLHELLRQLERYDLRIVALSIVDTVDFAVARLMVDQTDRAREIFALTGFTVIESDILGVELPDDPQPYVRISSGAARCRDEHSLHLSPQLPTSGAWGHCHLCGGHRSGDQAAAIPGDEDGHRVGPGSRR